MLMPEAFREEVPCLAWNKCKRNKLALKYGIFHPD